MWCQKKILPLANEEKRVKVAFYNNKIVGKNIYRSHLNKKHLAFHLQGLIYVVTIILLFEQKKRVYSSQLPHRFRQR